KLETRPYLRARAALARAYSVLGRHDDAIAECQALLDIEPDDALAIEYLLLNELVHAGRNEDALALAEMYPEEYSTDWLYNTALVKFRLYGDGIFPRQALMQAHRVSPHVLPYLLGEKKLPKRPPKDPDKYLEGFDALLYMATMQPAWDATPGAYEWASQILHDTSLDDAKALLAESTGPRFFLNPDPDYYDERHCIECHERTSKRDDYVVMLIEPNFVGAPKMPTRYCERCDILTANQETAGVVVNGMLEKTGIAPTGQPYLALGIVSAEDMREQDSLQPDSDWITAHIQGFKEYVQPPDEPASEGEFGESTATSPLILPGRYR
ncbi:MAG TPA: tetratricopeptide repeat protein, partial [Thermomicrobiales bacterium]|nr:tetratricopeptide repeat protein [Thermomicrobiales bacterium]